MRVGELRLRRDPLHAPERRALDRPVHADLPVLVEPGEVDEVHGNVRVVADADRGARRTVLRAFDRGLGVEHHVRLRGDDLERLDLHAEPGAHRRLERNRRVKVLVRVERNIDAAVERLRLVPFDVLVRLLHEADVEETLHLGGSVRRARDRPRRIVADLEIRNRLRGGRKRLHRFRNEFVCLVIRPAVRKVGVGRDVDRERHVAPNAQLAPLRAEVHVVHPVLTVHLLRDLAPVVLCDVARIVVLELRRTVNFKLDASLDRTGDLLQPVHDGAADGLEAIGRKPTLRRDIGLGLLRQFLCRTLAPVGPVLLIEVFLVAVFGLERPARCRVAGYADDPTQEPVILPVRVLVRAGDHRPCREWHARWRTGELHPVFAHARHDERSGVRLEVDVLRRIAAQHDRVVLVDRLKFVRDEQEVLERVSVAQGSILVLRLRRDREEPRRRVGVGDLNAIRLVGLLAFVAEAPHDRGDVRVARIARRREIHGQRRTLRVDHAERGRGLERHGRLGLKRNLRLVACRDRHGHGRGVLPAVGRDISD